LELSQQGNVGIIKSIRKLKSAREAIENIFYSEKKKVEITQTTLMMSKQKMLFYYS